MKAMTKSLEDYLETILLLQNKNNVVRVTDISLEMKLSKPSVNSAIKILTAEGLVEHEKYGDLILTRKGVVAAKRIANRHSLLKSFLTNILGVDEQTAERDACLIEHSVSSITIDRLKEFMDKADNS